MASSTGGSGGNSTGTGGSVGASSASALAYAGLTVGVSALALGVGYWLDTQRTIGTTGLLAFLVATAIIVVGVELIFGLSGQWLDRHMEHGRGDRSRMAGR